MAPCSNDCAVLPLGSTMPCRRAAAISARTWASEGAPGATNDPPPLAGRLGSGEGPTFPVTSCLAATAAARAGRGAGRADAGALRALVDPRGAGSFPVAAPESRDPAVGSAGCASGYGAAGVAAAGRPARVVIGVERDPTHLREAARRYPWLRILEGDATALPLPDACADAVVMLDMLEHLSEPRRAVQEAHRVLRPGGVVIVSLPHAGLLQHADSLNVYPKLQQKRPSWPPLPDADGTGQGGHRHYSVVELQELLAPWFVIDQLTRTGLGLAEAFGLGRLVVRARLNAPKLAGLFELLFVLTYLCEDLLPLGRLGHHLTVRAQAADGCRQGGSGPG